MCLMLKQAEERWRNCAVCCDWGLLCCWPVSPASMWKLIFLYSGQSNCLKYFSMLHRSGIHSAGLCLTPQVWAGSDALCHRPQDQCNKLHNKNRVVTASLCVYRKTIQINRTNATFSLEIHESQYYNPSCPTHFLRTRRCLFLFLFL